ncbi:MAG TPA: hypothetical protein VGU25_18430 [Acidobacteriaceae bacterium]|nr:hypothetical protein [Acidobacteriaceae bacterium]
MIQRLARGVSLAIALLIVAAIPAHASVSLLLEQPYGGLGVVNPTGHAALYLDHVCAASPVQLRPCAPGELGVVISRYDGITNHDWIAVPLLPYLYAVESPADIPQTMNREQETLLRDLYRRHALESVAPDLPNGGTPEGNWYELAGSAYDRTIYGFSLATTPEQDARLIAIFNDRHNVEHYNGAFRNCADFARTTINLLYPHAIRRNFVADFGLTTPKSVARALTHYASKHPGVDFQVFRIPQVPGSIPRSYGVQGVTESLLKRYGVPLVVLSPVVTGIVFVAYMGHGRFDMPRNAPVLDLRQTAVGAEESADVDALEHVSPPSLPLPTPSGVAMRTPLPLNLMTPQGPPPAVDTRIPDPSERIPSELFVPAGNN